MNDHDMLLTIQEMLDGVEWSADTLAEIADLLTSNGYVIRDIDDTQIAL